MGDITDIIFGLLKKPDLLYCRLHSWLVNFVFGHRIGTSEISNDEQEKESIICVRMG